MGKVKKAWFCQQCGAESAKWLGRCPACGQWNTFVEEITDTGTSTGSRMAESFSDKRAVAQPVGQIQSAGEARFSLRNAELDRLLGGGMVCGSMVLLGGEPGIGKSTLSLQIPLHNPQLRTLYVSGEESPSQIKMRADRIKQGGASDNCLVLCETNLDQILTQAKEVRPDLLIIDSIQTIFSQTIESSPGSVSQVRECAALLLKYAKQTNTAVILVGHITKEGSIAGPKVLEHIVDVVLQFEGDNRHAYRVLRSIKNRFGSTAELAIFEMVQDGLCQVTNPSEMLIPMHDQSLSGIAVATMLDGTRPFLIETQALVSTAAYGTAQRSATGFDIRRMNMLLAVLEKRAGFKLQAKDVFLNMAGGLKITDPAVDMAIVAAVLSSAFDVSVPSNWCFAAEVGLSGEIRPVSYIDRRIAEAEKLGFERIFISAYNTTTPTQRTIQVTTVATIAHLVRQLFQEQG